MTKDLILESIKEYQKEIDKLKERKMKTLKEIKQTYLKYMFI